MKKIIYWIFGILTGVVLLIAFVSFIKFNLTNTVNIMPVTYKDVITVSSPLPEDKITSPLVIKGEARGTWYFEGSFPVVLTDWDGLIIAQGIATAGGEWMTTDFVPFTATLNFTKPSYGATGSLILKKDNPSDLRQYDDALEIPVKF